MTMLNRLSDERKREAIASLSNDRIRGLLSGCTPGTPVQGFGLDEAMRATGSDFRVEGRPVFLAGSTDAVPGYRAAVNGLTEQPISIVSSTYGFVDHAQTVEPMREVLDRGDAVLQSIQLREGGAKFDASALLGFAAVERNNLDRPDGLAAFLRCGNAHDGTSNAWLAVSVFRLICTNGMSFHETIKRETRRHTSRVQTRMESFGSSIQDMLRQVDNDVETFQSLADTPMGEGEFVEFVTELFNADRGEVKSERGHNRRVNEITELLELFAHGEGNSGSDRYDALNAVTEWLTPRRERYEDAKRFAGAFDSNETGSRARTRSRAQRMLTR